MSASQLARTALRTSWDKSRPRAHIENFPGNLLRVELGERERDIEKNPDAYSSFQAPGVAQFDGEFRFQPKTGMVFELTVATNLVTCEKHFLIVLSVLQANNKSTAFNATTLHKNRIHNGTYLQFTESRNHVGGWMILNNEYTDAVIAIVP